MKLQWLINKFPRSSLLLILQEYLTYLHQAAEEVVIDVIPMHVNTVSIISLL